MAKGRIWLAFRAAVVCLLAFGTGLVGCSEAQNGAGGAGGEGGTGGDGETGLAGTLVGGPVAGVSFETTTHSGVTTEDGTFRYEEGETVRFFIGDTVLGETIGKEEVSLFDLVPDAEPVKGNQEISRASSNRCNPLASVINMTVLLQTLDQDGDPSNGITITGETAALFDGVSIDFAQHIRSLRQDPGLRMVLSQANRLGLLGDHRQVRSAAFAMQDLYALLGLDARLFVVLASEFDEGANDDIDSSNEFQYDGRGQLIFSARRDANGDLASSSRYEYDDHGHRVRSESDTDGNGVPDRITRYILNEDGDLTRSESDRDGDGDTDSVTTISYDEIGRVLREESDTNNNGEPDRIVTYWYDDGANRNGTLRDDDADGFIEESTTNFLDDNGLIIRREVDDGDDGTVNSRDTFEYDARGNTTRWERDRNGDGDLDDIDLYEHNEMCLQTYHEEREGDGTVTRTTTTTYDGAGRRLSRSLDRDADGMADSIDTYEYDEDGNLVFEADDSDGDGTPNSSRTYEFTDGALSRALNRADGVLQSIEYYTSEPTEGWASILAGEFFD